MNDSILNYSIKVHRSLLKRDLIFGVPQTALVIILMLTLVMVLYLYQYWFLAITVVLFLIARSLTKSDEYLIDIILDSLFQPDYLD